MDCVFCPADNVNGEPHRLDKFVLQVHVHLVHRADIERLTHLVAKFHETVLIFGVCGHSAVGSGLNIVARALHLLTNHLAHSHRHVARLLGALLHLCL